MRKLFKVNIIETGELQVEIEAETPEQAIEIAEQKYEDEEILLMADMQTNWNTDFEIEDNISR